MEKSELWLLFPSDVRKIKHAASLLNALADDSDRLDVLLDLQRFLVQRIRSRERMVLRVRKLEGRLKSLLRKGHQEKAASTRVKGLLAKGSTLIGRARRWIFLWKCFGDGAACVYQSPYNLKLLLYDHNYDVKQEAGFLTGKSGFDLEWKILEHGIGSGVPVVLSDLTNMIRIGDICALAGPDPMPIELKSSRTSGARAARQHLLLDEVSAFFQNDGAKQFKGLHNVERYAMPDGPDYRQQMNNCIRQAHFDGYAVVSPEPGLHYVAVTAADQVEKLGELLQPWVLLRSLSAELDWVPCLPFTLTLEPENLIAFIGGTVEVFVLTDMEHLKSLFLQHGNHATMIMDGQSAIQLCIDPSDLMRGMFRISELHFGRVALEFQSLAWFAKENAIRKQESEGTMTREEFEALPKGSYCIEIPETWAQAKDFYAEAHINPAQIQDRYGYN
jgi:hypothetical protein